MKLTDLHTSKTKYYASTAGICTLKAGEIFFDEACGVSSAIIISIELVKNPAFICILFYIKITSLIKSKIMLL